MTLLNLSGIFKQGETKPVLNDITFSQRKFQKIAIAGETGSGKSTLLKIIAGLLQPDAGNITFEGLVVEGPEQKLVPGHPAIAYLSQHFELQRFLRVEQILAYTNKLSDKQANQLYQICKIEHLLARNSDQLSGGEKQRIALARILISSPKLLLLDEPFSNLDILHKNILKSVINDVCKKLKITCILVSHDPGDTLSWADEILVMHHGAIVQQGSPQTLYEQPATEYIAGLFGKYNLLDIKQSKPFFKKAISGAKGRSVLIRPESFKLTTKGKNAVKGKVTQIFFFGSYYEIEVLVSEIYLIVKVDYAGISVGQIVYISFPSGHVQYVLK